MKYKNIKTGFTFETTSKIEGADWVEVKAQVEKKEEKPKDTKKKAKK